MRYIMVVIWSVLISSAISYVLASMGGEQFNFDLTLVLSGVLALGIILLGDVALGGKKEAN